MWIQIQTLPLTLTLILIMSLVLMKVMMKVSPAPLISSNPPDPDDGSAMDVDPPAQLDEDDDLAVLTARNGSKWCWKWLSTAKGQEKAILRWRDSLYHYHSLKPQTENSEVNYIWIQLQPFYVVFFRLQLILV